MGRLACTAALALAGLGGCGDDESPIANPHPGLVYVQVEVPPGADTAPFDEPRILYVPYDFAIRVVARVPGARFLAETPEGDLLVSQPGAGAIAKITDPAGAASVTAFATGLAQPHDMVFATRGAIAYLYVAENDRVSRAPWNAGGITLEPLVTGLPTASLPELHGQYAHGLKNIALAGDTLFVSIASATNADPSDQLADPVRGAIYAYPADGGAGRLYAKGLRNAEGLAIDPGTGALWAAVNHRDNMAYPLHDGALGFGELAQAYVNDHPAEPFTHVRDGGNYGWPYCDPDPDGGFDRPPYLPDAETNPDGSVVDCAAMDAIDKGLPAHSAPLGMSFWNGAAVIGLHGCWNCDVVHGYRVVSLAPRAGGGFEDAADLVAGWYPPENSPKPSTDPWGRPVDVIPNARGGLYISDDLSGTVYELTPR